MRKLIIAAFLLALAGAANAAMSGGVSTGAQDWDGEKTFNNGVKTDTISEKTAANGVAIDGVTLKDGGVVMADGASIEVDTINEATAAAGVTVDGIKMKDSIVYTDTIAEKTSTSGCTADGVLLKDGGIVCADGATLEVDTVNEATAAAGVTLDGIKLKDSIVYTDNIAEKTSTSGVTADGVLLKDGGVVCADGATLEVDTVNEATAAAGVTLDGIKLKDSIVYTDTIAEKTSTSGCTADGVLLKDGGIVCADAATLEVDTVNEATSAAGVTADGVLLKDGGIVCADGATVEADTINEATAAAGVTCDGVTLKDGVVRSSTGAGAAVSATSTAVELGDGTFHQTVITVASVTLSLADGDHGIGTKIYDFPEGRIVILSSVVNIDAVVSASVTGTLKASIGSATAGDDNDLTSTETDLAAKQTLAAGSVTFHAALAASTQLDGTSTASDAYLNIACADTDNNGAVTCNVSGTVTITWVNAGDY